MTARNADCVGSSDEPIAHSDRGAVAAADERRGVLARRELVEGRHLDGDAAVVEHRRQRRDGSGGCGGRRADAVADGQGGLVVAGLWTQPGGGALGVGAGQWPSRSGPELGAYSSRNASKDIASASSRRPRGIGASM